MQTSYFELGRMRQGIMRRYTDRFKRHINRMWLSDERREHFEDKFLAKARTLAFRHSQNIYRASGKPFDGARARRIAATVKVVE